MARVGVLSISVCALALLAGHPRFDAFAHDAFADQPFTSDDARLFLMLRAQPPLPPVAANTTELKFSDIFKRPVGPRGLEPTEAFLSLIGKRARMVGFMVHQQAQMPGAFVLTPYPVSTADIADGPADDLPPSAVYVHLPTEYRERQPPYFPSLLMIEGTLEFGPREETDGRISHVRLRLEWPQSESRPVVASTDSTP